MTPPSSLRSLPPEGAARLRPGRAGSAALAGSRIVLSLVVVLSATVHAQQRASQVLDAFDDATPWQATASDQVKASLRRDARDGSLCLDYDFAGVSGYAVMRRELPIQWPAHFEVGVRLKGSGPPNHLQVKWVDASGDNVWWVNRPDTTLPPALTELTFRPRHVQFAWGPTADKTLRQTRFVEFVIAAGKGGGAGTVCVARLTLAEREPDPAVWPEPTVQQRPDAVELDFGRVREFNGLALTWPRGAAPRRYDVWGTTDDRRWRLLRRVHRSAGPGPAGTPDALFLPEHGARRLRITAPGLRRAPAVALKSAAEWPDFNAVLKTLAAAAPRGDLPRAFLGQQNYWTLIGVDGGGQRSALLSEDGAVEIGRGGFSIEPAVLLADGSRVTWANAGAVTQSLREGHLPIARVHWRHPAFGLDVEAGADGPLGAPVLLTRYVLANTSAQPQALTLQLALRPWQVNPPQQFLSTPGGASEVRRLQRDGSALLVEGRGVRQGLRFSRTPHRYTALPFDGGLSLAALQAAPSATRVLSDPQGHASALLQWRFVLRPGEQRTVAFTAPLAPPHMAPPPAASAAGRPALAGPRDAALPPPVSADQVAARLDAAGAHWRERLERVTLQLPGDDGRLIADTLRTSLAHMLLSRDGPALRPGTRSYARTWIRDGAMMVAGLVRLGEIAPAREFIDWYAGHVFPSGKVPCCVDERGADPVVENDSHGQYLYAVAEVLRHGGGDAAWAARHWPTVQRVMAWMEALRQGERTPANRQPGREHLFGLMPPSISHEGYSDKPAYSYWDDFWALRGYKDAVWLAERLGHAAEARRWAPWRDEFERELAASIEATARVHGIGVIAGAADRGDFDATSTTMALNPAQAALPDPLLRATFERYWQEMDARSRGERAWKDYTPYELRTVGALTRLGWPGRAHAMLDFFFGHQRPAGWKQWAEVVLPDAREPRFLGDMPHAWVSSDYVRSALDLVAYEDEGAGALVIGAGLKPAWLAQGDVLLRGLSTPHGLFDLSLTRRPGGWRLELPRQLRGLPGGVRLRWPERLPLPRAVLDDGRELAWQGRELQLPARPLHVDLQQRP